MIKFLCILYLPQGDGRPFWKLVVSEATGCADDDYFDEVYKVISLSFRNHAFFVRFMQLKSEYSTVCYISLQYYANGNAWHLPDGAHETLLCLKNAGGISPLNFVTNS